MAVLRINILGNPNIGIYSLATDKFGIIPVGVTKRKIEQIIKVLKINILNLDIGYSKLIGVLVAANSNGIVLPHYTSDEEIYFLKKNLDVKVGRVESNKTAFGNMVLANDHGALVSPLLGRSEIKTIQDILDVEAALRGVADSPFVGSVAAATNKGVLVHPKVSDAEKELISEILKVPVSVGTVNQGVQYVSSGILMNSYGALVGSLTTGPELMSISTLL